MLNFKIVIITILNVNIVLDFCPIISDSFHPEIKRN